jgi:hypothetical protein
MPSVYSREHYLQNRDLINARTMKNYYNNRVERLERFKEYYEKNKEALKQKRANRCKAKRPTHVFKISHDVIVNITG